MNPVVVATDFSGVGANAMHYAAALAKHTGRKLILLNIYRLPVPMGDMPALFMPLEELQQTAEEQLARSREEVLKKQPGLDVQIETIPGTVNSAAILEYADEFEPFVLIMGTHGLNGIENWLGSTTLAVIKEAACPVIAVPANYSTYSFSNIAWASDMKPLTAYSVSLLKNLVGELKASLTIVHVAGEENNVSADYYFRELSELNPGFEPVTHSDVITGLQGYLAGAHADLLLVVPHHHSLFETLFEKKHTRSLISEMPLPVLCIPEKNN